MQIQEMAAKYGFDISARAECAGSGAVALLRLSGGSEIANRGAMSLGRTASFLDIDIERDFKAAYSMSSRHRN
ncbi:hypothetical protein ACLK17_19125 [Escherichia coli]